MDTIFQEIKQELQKFVKKDFVLLTKRGNDAINYALQIAKEQGKTECFILDQGGWITYPKYIKKHHFVETRMKTNVCEINPQELDNKLHEHAVLLIHSLSGYWYKQPMKKIQEICQRKKALLITDIAGSITDENLVIGDIILGSFGRWKPINNESGGFVATNLKVFKHIDDSLEIQTPEKLLEKIKKVQERVDFLNTKSCKIIEDIKAANLKTFNNDENNSDLHLVVVAPYKTKEEKETLISIARSHEVPFEECPREIRTNENAISFEVKKL